MAQLNPAIMRFDVQVNFSRAVQTLVQTLPANIVAEIRKKALLETSAKIVATAKTLCPVDTYALKQSIRARWNPRNKLSRQGRADAQPFLRPALHSHIIDFHAATVDSINAAIRRSRKTGRPPKDSSHSFTTPTFSLAAFSGSGGGSGGEAGESIPTEVHQMMTPKRARGRSRKAKNVGYGFDLTPNVKSSRGRRRGH